MISRPTARDYAGVSLFWFAVSFFWGALLTIVLPARIESLFGAHDKDRIFALIAAAGALVASFTQIVFGALSDGSHHPWGRRRPFLLVGTLAACVSLLFFPAAHTVAALLGAFALVQMCLNVATGPYQALMADRIATQFQGRAAAFLGVASLLGRIGGALVASRLLMFGEVGFRWLFWIFALLLLVFMFATLFFAPETPLRAKSDQTLPQRLRAIWNVPLKPYPSFCWMLVSRAGIMLGVYTVNFCLLFYIRDTLGFDERASYGVASKFLVISTITGLLGTIPAGKLSDSVGRKPVLYAANGIGIAAGLVFALAGNINVALVAAAIFGASYGAFSAVDWALATNLLPPGEPAKYMGVWGIADTLPQVVAPLVGGPVAFWVNQNYGLGSGYRALMLLSLLYFALGTFAIRFIQEIREIP